MTKLLGLAVAGGFSSFTLSGCSLFWEKEHVEALRGAAAVPTEEREPEVYVEALRTGKLILD